MHTKDRFSSNAFLAMMRRTMVSSPGYRPVRTETDAYTSERSHPASNGELDEEEIISLLSEDGDELTSKTSRTRARLSKNGGKLRPKRLSRIYIAITASIVAAIAASITIAGYAFYELDPVDGQSPPWYPSPQGGTLSSWEKSYKKAKEMVEKMSLIEKVNITTGTGWSMNLCVGNTGPALSVGFPSLCLQDGPLGIRFADQCTAFPAGITVGATWNKTLMRLRAIAHGEEVKGKGINVLLGPSMGPLGRHPAGGRFWEGFGADPVLQGIAAAETIKGIQSQGVIATAKHWIGNEQEHFRKAFEWGLPHAISSNIDDRALHEIYAWPFAESIRAGVAAIMCSYNLVNNSYVCGNSALLNGILKDELGFQGFVLSDWNAQRSGVASVLAGLDMAMPGDGLRRLDPSLLGEQMTIAALNGSLPMERVNDMATRIVAAWYQVGQDSWNSTGPNFSSWTRQRIGKLHQGVKDDTETGVVNQFIDVRKDHHVLAREVAAQGIVLVKNEDNILPLDHLLKDVNPKFQVAILGEDAGPGDGPNACRDNSCNQGTLAVGWGSGSSNFTYLVDPTSALTEVFGDHVDVTTYLHNDIPEELRKKLKNMDVCLVFANADSGEGYLSWENVRGDRNDLNLQKDGDTLIKSVAKSCENTIVIIHAVGPVLVEKWADFSNVKAIVLAHLPGQESGNALVDVLFGYVDSTGRLPYTVGRKLDDYGTGAKVMYYPNAMVPQADFKEGLYIDYRYFDKSGIEPRYPFGFGLSYTRFQLSDLNITELKAKSKFPSPRPGGLTPPSYDSNIPDPTLAVFPNGFRKLRQYVYPYISSVDQIKKGQYPYPPGYDDSHILSEAGGGEGGNPSLFEIHLQVSTRVTNIGTRNGQTVIQIYVSFPEGFRESEDGPVIDFPVKVLRNFDKVELSPGDFQIISLNLTRKDLSYWSVVHQNWIMPEGEFGVLVGQHSRDAFLEGVY